ncbi:MAG TPA: deazaflavin-dependent nitroreductase, partial [Chloroflexia bacterium]|nr:deazaflavin-dependent nitroreductase [Chloroflexia bacterium]
MSNINSLPRWLKPANKLVIALQRMGLPLGTIHVLSVPGRRSGKMRTTPVSLMTVNGTRYIIGGAAQADWVKNAQASGWGIL